jgi:membrane-associated HD superfamily phosphohydrolase
MSEEVTKNSQKDALSDSIPKKLKGDDEIVLALIKQAESFFQTMNEARSKSQYSSVVKAQENISKLARDISKHRAIKQAQAEPVDGVASKKATLKAVRASRAAAFSDGSYGPANNLLEREMDLVYSIIADDSKVSDVLTEEEMFDVILHSCSELSAVQKARLLKMLE